MARSIPQPNSVLYRFASVLSLALWRLRRVFVKCSRPTDGSGSLRDEGLRATTPTGPSAGRTNTKCSRASRPRLLDDGPIFGRQPHTLVGPGGDFVQELWG